MDTHLKAGQVYLQPQKQGKKWKKLWLSLYPPSGRGVSRLELQEVGGAGLAQEKRVIRLAECVSVFRLPPHAEACPGENMAAFCVETDERRLVMAAGKEECVDWVERVCEIAFQRGGGGVSSVQQQQQQPRMEENQIYVSRELVSAFWVVVQQSDAALRCGLQGAYWLQVHGEELVLKEAETRRSLWSWSYRLLRRYGGDKLTFSIEAGRRCDSGPGTFTFDTPQGERILALIENAIREQKAAAAVAADNNSNRLGVAVDLPASRRPCSPLPQLPVGAAILDGGKPQSSEEGVYSQPADAIGSEGRAYARPADLIGSAEEGVYSQPADAIGSEGCVYSQPADSIGLADERVYSQPADCVKPPKGSAPNPHPSLPQAPAHPAPSSVSRHSNPAEPVYADPVGYIPLKPPRTAAPPPPPSSAQTTDQSEPVYDEVCDRAGPLQTHQDQNQNQNRATGREEPIYTVPCVGGGVHSISTPAAPPGPAREEPKTDPYAHLYAQICKVELNTPQSTAGDHSPEVIYENLGVI